MFFIRAFVAKKTTLHFLPVNFFTTIINFNIAGVKPTEKNLRLNRNKIFSIGMRSPANSSFTCQFFGLFNDKKYYCKIFTDNQSFVKAS